MKQEKPTGILLKESEAKPEEEEVKTDTTEPGEFDASIKLKSFKISNAKIAYDDRESGMKASLDNYNFELKGDIFATVLYTID